MNQAKNNTLLTDKWLEDKLNIDKYVINLVKEAEEEVLEYFKKYDDIKTYNQYKIIDAFQNNKISDMHFSWNTGYGYDDPGREALEKVYSDIFNTEAAIVRPIIVNGTHALTLTLSGILRPNDHMIYATGKPYDTLESVIGIRDLEKNNGSLKEFGILYDQVELTENGSIDLENLKNIIKPNTKMVCIQRATGYDWRKAISIEEIEKVTSFVHDINPEIICMADNCYGEFLNIKEPTDVGIDVMAGSLIKNPGGGLVLSGGYIVGKKELIEKISYRMTSPGIGGECGLMFGQTRTMFQGLFLAPQAVNAAVKGAILCSKVFEKLDYEVSPKSNHDRSDIIQGIKLNSPEAMSAFAIGIQKAAPIDSHVEPIAWNMPGYDTPVIMAAGAFVQGSSIELSADGPVKEPYNIYFQGGLTYEHSKFGVIRALQEMIDRKIVNYNNFK